MENAYRLNRSPFGLDRQYPKEKSKARSSLFKSQEARNAIMKRHKVQIKYPARLCVNGRTIIDMFPELFQVLGHDRLVVGNTEKMNIKYLKTQAKKKECTLQIQ
ncbi:hypothetical protein DPMN_152241 [Dreissena polymorpha]|uniref:Uncharacterized protein n=1 Tax=Dreissena polymorpha TaxID=45954 RepID=A0A9D4FH46_DREPO|nr:hypothetical protein DPMN_152241 [Dreissena polymorpha]